MKTVAEFKIHYRQILDPGGKTVAPLPEFAKDSAEILRMYRAMTLVRVFDAKAVNLQRTGNSAPIPPASATRPPTSASAPRCAPRTCWRPSIANSARSFGAASP